MDIAPFNVPVSAKDRAEVIKIRDGTEVAARHFVYKFYDTTGGQPMRILARIVSADVPVGAGHRAKLEPTGGQRRINFLPALLAHLRRAFRGPTN